MNAITPTLQPGYAFRSSKRYPKAPETVVQSETAARYVGLAYIDGTWCHAFRAGRVYYFTVATYLYGK